MSLPGAKKQQVYHYHVFTAMHIAYFFQKLVHQRFVLLNI